MHSALIFATRFLVSAMFLAYVLAMLASSCLPVSDPMGEVMAVPRWEFWLLHASVPSAMEWQWTGGGLPINVSDRFPILLAATLWLCGCALVGTAILLVDPTAKSLSRFERLCIAILVGQATLSAIVFVIGSVFGLAWIAIVLSQMLLAVIVGIVYVSYRKAKLAEPNVAPELSNTSEHLVDRVGGDHDQGLGIDRDRIDPSFATSINRRMVGLLIIATVYLSVFQVYGATIPTQDVQVREVDWWNVKHTAIEGRIGWAADHAMANAPSGSNMASIAFASVFTIGLPDVSARSLSNVGAEQSIEDRENWNRRLLQSVLAGKTVNAMLTLVGVLLVSVHLMQRFGYLPGILSGFMIVATPGIAELVRLGRTEAMLGVWAAALLVVWHNSRRCPAASAPSASLHWSWGCLIVGAFHAGYGSAVLVGLPATGLWIRQLWLQQPSQRKQHWTRRFVNFIALAGIALTAAVPYARNAWVSGDPIFPWSAVITQRMGIENPNAMFQSINKAFRVSTEAGQPAAYGIRNGLDCISRVLWNSNAHGLILVPFALVGMLLMKSHAVRLAIAWFVFWIATWWLISTRQDRDWVGGLILLAWPAAAGTRWIAERARGYLLLVLVSIAIVWSVVVIPIWPTSDNRVLVALETLVGNETTLDGPRSPDREEFMKVSIAGEFNSVVRSTGNGNAAANAAGKVLLVGDSDDFDFLLDSVSNGPFESGLLDACLNVSSDEVNAVLRSKGIAYVLIRWDGVRFRDQLTGQDSEESYRAMVLKSVQAGKWQSVAWRINSSQAELFRMIE